MLKSLSTPAAELQPAATDESFRYDYRIDLSCNNNHAKVVRLVGTGKRVLELGCATGYMSQVFRDRGCQVVAVELDARAAARALKYCERVIVGDLDVMDLGQVLGGARFDVVVAADVLEHLKEPPAVLQAVRKCLRPGAYVVACIPNVAHGSVRLALLRGEFPYSERGLLDRTHLRFFTRQTIEQLFENAGYEIRHLERQDMPIEASEVPFDAAAIPPGVLEALSRDPDALTYQFIVVAYPLAEEVSP